MAAKRSRKEIKHHSFDNHPVNVSSSSSIINVHRKPLFKALFGDNQSHAESLRTARNDNLFPIIIEWSTDELVVVKSLHYNCRNQSLPPRDKCHSLHPPRVETLDIFISTAKLFPSISVRRLTLANNPHVFPYTARSPSNCNRRSPSLPPRVNNSTN